MLLTAVMLDVRTRTIPLWFFYGWLLITIGLSFWTEYYSIGGILAGALLGIVADVPGGDLRVLILLGAMIGPGAVALVITGALVLTLMAWWKGLTGVPWTVYIAIVYPIVWWFFPPLYSPSHVPLHPPWF